MMNIDDYEAELILSIKEFFSDWKKNSSMNSEDWPLDMLKEDWDEQILSEFF